VCVKEELVINKKRSETISDTVRRIEVEVEDERDREDMRRRKAAR
jgi:hypothetical protein